MEDNEIQLKQSLLQSEIIEKNYDKLAFIDFCLGKKENGDDLNSWTLDELREITKEFISTQSEGQTPTGLKTEETKDESTIEDGFIELKKEDIDKMEIFNEDSNNFKEKVIICRKLKKTILNEQKLIISVRNPKEMDGGVFGKKYILYEVETEPIGYVVVRRYSDFVNLRKLIVKHFPSFFVPPLPNKKIGNKRFNQHFIDKRMKLLNLFINQLVQNESFKSSEILVSFLTCEDKSQFDSKCKEFTTSKPSAFIEDYKTLDGKVTISHDERNENISLILIHILNYKGKF